MPRTRPLAARARQSGPSFGRSKWERVTDLSRQYLFFTHVLKAGGTSVEAALRRTLGVRHMAVDPPVGWIYTEADFAFDRRINPFAYSYSSHWLRPFVSFGALDRQIRWYTMLREPLSRYRSHRQHHIERFGVTAPFDKWAANPILRNWQTRQIAGSEDVEAAKQILRDRYSVIGLLERMDVSLALFRNTLGLPKLPIAPREVHNGAHSDTLRVRLEEELTRNEDIVRSSNELDLELYSYVATTLFPEQVKRCGENYIQGQLEEARRSTQSALDPVRSSVQLLYRRAVQMPITGVRKQIVIRSGRRDIRH